MPQTPGVAGSHEFPLSVDRRQGVACRESYDLVASDGKERHELPAIRTCLHGGLTSHSSGISMEGVLLTVHAASGVEFVIAGSL
jgi:hypothetical protein